jgi:hypothetical protein
MKPCLWYSTCTYMYSLLIYLVQSVSTDDVICACATYSEQVNARVNVHRLEYTVNEKSRQLKSLRERVFTIFQGI